MTCTTLLDGYNVIFSCGLYGKHATAESLAQGRERLLKEITQRFGAKSGNVTVVFDAKKTPLSGQKKQQVEYGIDVHYAIGYSNADLLIDELISIHPDPQRLTVISSDHWVQNAARRRRAQFVDSEQWYFEDVSKKKQSEPNLNSTNALEDISQTLLSDTEKESWKSWEKTLHENSELDRTSKQSVSDPARPADENIALFPQDYLEELQRQLRDRPQDDS